MRHRIALAAAITGLGLTLALVLLLGGSSVPVARAAGFTVDILTDENDGSCTPGDCSLREAIIEANKTFEADEITLGAGIHELTIRGSNENDCATGDLDVTESVTITGLGPDQTFIDASGLGTDRALHIRHIHPSGTVFISGVTIMNGSPSGSGGAGYGGGLYNTDADLTLSNVKVYSNTAGGAARGGGIYIYRGDATLIDVDVISNTVEGTSSNGWGGGIFFGYDSSDSIVMDRVRIISNTSENYGGGLYLHDANLTVRDGQILSNTAERYGGGLDVSFGEATVSGGEIRGNTAEVDGGGVYLYDAVFTQTGATEIAHNMADYGGGLYIRQGSTATLTGAGIYSNTASEQGGGMLVGIANVRLSSAYVTSNTAEEGGGIYNWDTLALVNTTVSGNRAVLDGGGIRNEHDLELVYSTVAHNTSGGGSGGISNQQDAYAQNTIVAANTPYNCRDDTLNSNGYNLEDSDTCAMGEATDQQFTDPKLLPLAEDQGTKVHALQPDSPAIDAGICVNGIPTDQRGVARPQGAAGLCDTGAYEFNLIKVYLPLVLR